MILICCIDDHMGMTFHQRRQSQDRLLRARLLEKTAGKLWMNQYSANQFVEAQEAILVDENCVRNCPSGDYCFVENLPVCSLMPEKILLYRWNRSYPADQYFDLPLGDWHLLSTADFPGYSHERITEEVYVK